MLIFAVEDLNAIAERLVDHGIALVSEPSDRPEWGIRAAHLRDPDGNLIELNSPLPVDQWTETLQELDAQHNDRV